MAQEKYTLRSVLKALINNKKLSLDEKAFLLSLWNNDDRNWKISYRQLVKDFNLSLSTIQRYVKNLSKTGYLLVYRDSKFSSIWIVMLVPWSKDELELKKKGFIKVFGSKERAEKMKQLDIFEASKEEESNDDKERK